MLTKNRRKKKEIVIEAPKPKQNCWEERVKNQISQQQTVEHSDHFSHSESNREAQNETQNRPLAKPRKQRNLSKVAL